MGDFNVKKLSMSSGLGKSKKPTHNLVLVANCRRSFEIH